MYKVGFFCIFFINYEVFSLPYNKYLPLAVHLLTQLNFVKLDPVIHHWGQFVHPNFLQNEAHECVWGRNFFFELCGFKLNLSFWYLLCIRGRVKSLSHKKCAKKLGHKKILQVFVISKSNKIRLTSVYEVECLINWGVLSLNFRRILKHS